MRQKYTMYVDHECRELPELLVVEAPTRRFLRYGCTGMKVLSVRSTGALIHIRAFAQYPDEGVWESVALIHYRYGGD